MTSKNNNKQVGTKTGASFQSMAQAWGRLKQNRAAVFSAYIIGFIILLAILAPLISPYSFESQDLYSTYVSPSSAHWLGTDELGRDMLSRLLYGARISMAIAVLSTITIVLIGTVFGAIAGYYGGNVDNLMMRFVAILYALPYLFF